MGFDTEKSFIMAERLKQLREERGLSHEKLSKALFDQYGVKISSDSLINYEVANARHTKAYKNQGMRVEYLRCLADFYGVSADYLIGIADVQSTDLEIRSIVKRTGLSEQCVQRLIYMKNMGFGTAAFVLDVLVLDDEYSRKGLHEKYRSVLDLLWFFFEYDGSGNRQKIDTRGRITDSDPADVFLDTIELDDVLVENAALSEIQQALTVLKKAITYKRKNHSQQQ